MIDLIRNFKEDLLAEPKGKLEPQPVDRVILCGMGGSAISYFIAEDVYGSEYTKTTGIVRDYQIPKVDEKTLVVCTSYSGNTEETLSCAEQAKKEGGVLVGIGSGGKLEGLCDQFVKVKAGRPPRTAFPLLFKALLRVLDDFGLLKMDWKAFESAVNAIDVNERMQSARTLATDLEGFVPIIYNYGYEGVAMRAKDEFNENTKLPSAYAMFPELCHNDIVGWKNLSKLFKVVFLRSDDEPERMKKRIDITWDLLQDRVATAKVDMKGTSRLEKALNTVLLFDLASVMLAEHYGSDPEEVRIIDELKKRLA